MMKKNFLTIFLILLILSIPLMIFEIISMMMVKPSVRQPMYDFPNRETKSVSKSKMAVSPIILTKEKEKEDTPPSKIFMNGYYDGWNAKWRGPVRWALNDDYRQGHMLGVYDRQNDIPRYPPE